MADGDVHTVHKDGSWTNTIEGGSSPARTFDTKDDAVTAGRDLARKAGAEHLIHREDGAIAERNSYGNDPADRPG
jgi:hypothetical protein